MDPNTVNTSTLSRPVRFAYIRKASADEGHGRPVGVVAYRIVDGVLEVGASFCAPRDTFDKKWGRELAEIRLDQKPTRRSVSHLNPDYLYKIVHLLAMQLATEPSSNRFGKTPSWVGSSARIQREVSRLTADLQTAF